jgi:AraC family transcriptional regulator of adaptative response / DNA-3-methyladenine glycosylase II
MDLDRQVCSRARLTRDPRFDGKFFIAVLTTGIYCRPICPARTCKEENVLYFPTAAAAAEAGFRPCLRCRPESSAGSPWPRTSNTVSRALRLIGESGLHDGVEGLAEHLGIGSRHLRRLFLKHLGATPSGVAQTRRLQFAKKLIDETSLPMVDVALASGFGSVRRFNGAIRDLYDRTPTQLRHLARKTPAEAKNQYRFRLSFRPPYDWKSLMAFLAARITPGVEAVDGASYIRSISVNNNTGYFEVSFCPSEHAIEVRVQIGDPRSLFIIVERVRAMFDLDADWSAISRILGADPVLAPYVRSHPGLRLPGCWNGFELSVQAITGARGGNTLVRALGQPLAPGGRLTHLFPTPEALAIADLEGIGISREKARCLRTLSRAVCDGELTFEKITSGDAFVRRLSEIQGLKKSIAQWLAMRVLRDPDAFPFFDRTVGRALGIQTSAELKQRSLRWRPWRAYGAMYLLILTREKQT